MSELLNYIISHIVDDPAQVKITKEETEGEIILNLEIPEEFRGIVIGKGGMNIKAIRNLVSIIARREGTRVNIKIKD